MQWLDHNVQLWAQSLGWPGEAMLRLVLAVVLGGLVGAEREARGPGAGLRTNLLVSMGSALVMLVSTQFARMTWQSAGAANVNVDPARVAYGVMAGIGFLGAGAIIKHDGGIRGLTTAAGIWCVAAVGLACGLGMYVIATVATVVVLIALALLSNVARIIPSRHYRSVVLRLPWAPDCVASVSQWFGDKHLTVGQLSYERVGDLKTVEMRLVITCKAESDLTAVEEQLAAHPHYDLIAVGAPLSEHA